MKKASACLAAGLIAAMMGLARQASAATSDDVGLSVTVANSVSVVLGADYDFQSVSLAAATINTSAITVNNDSGGIREDYSLSAIDNSGDGWSLAASAGADQYHLQAIFDGTAPPHGDYAAGDDITTTDTAASATVYAGTGSSGEEGFDVTDTAGTHERSLFFRLEMPTTITGQPSSPFITVWVMAVAG